MPIKLALIFQLTHIKKATMKKTTEHKEFIFILVDFNSETSFLVMSPFKAKPESIHLSHSHT
jgi:flagellar assembly factor FliW